MEESFHELVSQVVKARFGESAKVSSSELVKDGERNVIRRVFLEGQETPSSVIAKMLKTDHRRGYTDLASLRFLSGIEGMQKVAPRIVGASDSGRVFLMEDLGPARSLDKVLAKGDEMVTVQHLMALARQMARLVVATLGQGEEKFAMIRRQYPGYLEVGREAEVMNWRAGLSRLESLADRLGLRIPRPAALCVQQLGQTYAEAPGALAFSHGDPAPTNNHIGEDGRVRLIDFEYGAYRHFYYDLTGWFILCPLPLRWVDTMVTAFRTELALSLPEVANPLWHARQWSAISAYRGIAMLTWISESAVEEDRPWVGAWSARSAMISTSLRLHQATASVPELAPFAEFSQALGDSLQSRWPELGKGEIKWAGVGEGAPEL